MRHFFFCCLLLNATLVTAQTSYYIRFPDDIYETTCANGFTIPTPQVFNTGGGNVGIEYTDAIIEVVPDACYIIERQWLIKSPHFDPALPCISVPNPRPSALINNPLNLPGPTVSPAGTPFPWMPTLVKVNPGDPAPTDYSTFWSATANCYAYTQRIKVIDATDPVVQCPTQHLTFEDRAPSIVPTCGMHPTGWTPSTAATT